ncbi:hypothetical protein Btru_013965 [Bulinus truncatus]|nr:hypothetical protein Btru_013965 [Bulinus truncatus]
MTAYTKEFEKWLNSSHDKIHDDDEDDEENKIKNCQPPDEDNDCPGDSIGEDSSQSSFAEFSKDQTVTVAPFHLSAPILIDDDDVDEEMLSYSHFEDEPPILEPVPKLLAGNRTPSAHSPKLTHKESLRSYSRTKHSYSRQRSLQESDMKTYSGRNSFHHTLSDDYEKRRIKNINAKNSKESGNIFDKFLSESYDSPPPLIPSPEALKLQCDSQVRECKHPGHSPDFCAMEADSTSEITCGKETHSILRSCQTKNSADVLIECDSTCMFGASPAFVSPASVSCGDSEEMAGADDIECNQERNLMDQDLDSAVLCSNQCCDKMITDGLPSAPRAELLTTEVVSQAVLQLDCVSEKAWTHVDDNRQKTFHETENNINVNNDEPPILAIMPPLPLSHMGSRLKRHTIDSPETYSRTHKQHNRDCPTALDYSAIPSSPPILTCISQSDTYSRHERKRSTKTLPKNSFGKLHDDVNRKRRRRHCSVPLTDQPLSMSDSVHSFVAGTCLLSRLKTRMHTLLMYIFPQIRPDMKSLSPESPLLLNILSDLICILKHPEQGSHTGVGMASVSKNKASGALNLSGAPYINTCHNLIGSHLSTTSASSPPHITCDISSKQQPGNGGEHLDSEFTISKLSSLSIKEPKDSIKPLVILLTKDPQADLKQFCQLSCAVMQLLLPDLSVNLCDELADCPADLIVFLDNVLMLNAKSKIKTYKCSPAFKSWDTKLQARASQ